jgi:hypothetical protein
MPIPIFRFRGLEEPNTQQTHPYTVIRQLQTTYSRTVRLCKIHLRKNILSRLVGSISLAWGSMPSNIPTKYTVLNLPQVYMLGNKNCLHLLVRSVVSPDRAKDPSRVLQAELDDTDLDIKQANRILC